MASSNVQYYEKQKELQDTITNCEQQRMNLERQFRMALQSDQTSNKMKASRLQTYWKKICDDERRAKQRNEMLMREFERIDAHMSEMNARTQRLALMKKQYEDYILRTYPEWNELMNGSPQREHGNHQQEHHHHDGPQRQHGGTQQQHGSQQQQPGDPQQQRDSQQQHHGAPQQQHSDSQQEQQPIRNSSQHEKSDSVNNKQSQNAPSMDTNAQTSFLQLDTAAAPENLVPEIKQSLPGRLSVKSLVPESKISQQKQEQARRQEQQQQQQRLREQQEQQQLQQEQQEQEKRLQLSRDSYTPTQNRPNNNKGHNRSNDGNGSGIYANLPSARSDEQVSGHTGQAIQQKQQQGTMSQPIKSVEIQSRTSGQTVQANSAMDPEGDEEDEETSEFGTDSELPMGQSLGNTQIRVDAQNSTQKENLKQFGPIKPELSVDGLINLLKHIELDITNDASFGGYYKSSWPDTAQKSDIIRKANKNEDLSHVDADLISMVVLEQITLIIRNLAEKCVLPEPLLQGNVSTLTATKVRQHLSPEGQVIWDVLFGHFIELVKGQVMEPNELSAIFTPSLVANEHLQDKGHMFIVQLLEGMRTSTNSTTPQWNKSMSPRQTLEGSGSLMEDGRVPPLKFGSLLDRPLSDDESSYINSSLPRDTVPLNETAAYKSMLSSSGGPQPRRQSSAQEDTDDDVEKQIASALTKKPVSQLSPQRRIVEADDPSETSSQTLQTPSHVYVPTAMEPSRNLGNLSARGQPKLQGVKISSDLDTDTEVDAGIFGSSRQPEDNLDFDFYD